MSERKVIRTRWEMRSRKPDVTNVFTFDTREEARCHRIYRIQFPRNWRIVKVTTFKGRGFSKADVATAYEAGLKDGRAQNVRVAAIENAMEWEPSAKERAARAREVKP